MKNKERITLGARFYDWQVSANVVVIDLDRGHLYPKCRVESTGATYYARCDALEDLKD